MTLSDGFALAVFVMAGMVAALAYTGVAVVRALRGADPRPTPTAGRARFAVPALALAGLVVAGYLSYVETQAVPAVCGPIGDCNTVQNSPYARLLGVPVGVLGLIGYAAILGVWLWGGWRSDALAGYAPLAVFCLALFGVMLSLYLTYLEPFVIRAVCLWCLASAVIITLVMLASLSPMLQAISADEFS